MIDPLTVTFMDIAVTHASGTPASRSVTLVRTRQPGATVAETLTATGARWLAAHDDSWAARLGAAWPPGALRFGGWRLVHVEGTVANATGGPESRPR